MFEEWRATAVGDGPADRPVTVPGRPEAFAGADGVTYETTFPDPRDPGDDVAVVTLSGLYAHAEIEVSNGRLDGEAIGDLLDGVGPVDRLDGDGTVTHDAYFRPARVPIRPAEENALAVTCYAPRDRFGGLHDTDRVPETDRVPGIWWDASLEAHPLPYVDRLQVRPELTDDGARLHVRTTVVTGGPTEERITYSLKPVGDLQTRGMMDRGTVEAGSAGRTTVEHTIEVRDPALWWPRNLGDQHRYRLQAKLGDSERSVTTGIRTVERDGSDLLVNGEPLRIRGVNLLTDDPADVERAASLHANLLRAPAHVLSPAVYEACDEAGLLVWQGLPLTGPGAFDVERGRELAGDIVGARGHRPSFGLLGVHDEPTDTYADGLGSGFLDRLRLRWRAWRVAYDRAPADRVADRVAERYPVVPVVGPPGIDHDAAAYYPGWDYGSAEDIDDLLARYPTDLLAAFGAGAVAVPGNGTDPADTASVGERSEPGDGSEMADPGDAAGFDARKHDARVDGGPEASQAYQADVLRTVAERARRRGLGVVATALRDTDAAGMGVYAVDGTPKDGRDALATALQPVQAFLADPSPGESEVVVVNDAPESLSATLSWVAGDAAGERAVTVPATDRWTDTIEVPDADAITLAVTVGEATVENAYEL